MCRYVVFTADDFGVSEAANRAIASAHADGVLTSVSLMVCENAASHAASLAADLPELGVGLHVTLSDGLAAQSHADAPGLVGANGRFRRSPLLAGMAYWFRGSLRSALRREIVAQFDRCEHLGLRLDHADGHQHLHVHPVIWDAMVEECARRGVGWIRLPVEPCPGLRRTNAVRAVEQAAFRTLARRCRRAATAHGVRMTDRVIGHMHTGLMDEVCLLNTLNRIGEGTTEVYSHPGANQDELAALTSGRLAGRLRELGIAPVSFADIP